MTRENNICIDDFGSLQQARSDGNSLVDRVYVNYVLWFLSLDPAKTSWHFFGTQIRFKRISDREMKHICAI